MNALGALVGAALAAGLVVALASPPAPPPSFAAVKAAWCPSDVHLLDRHGETLRVVRTDATVRRLAWTPLADVSPALVSAVLASEDRRFFEHDGVDLRALGAAAWQRLHDGSSRGASTIAMQVSALVDPTLRRASGSRSIAAKWRQMRAAWKLEGEWSKDEVLEAYLNLVTFRGEVQGVAAAADTIFAKAPHGLSPAEGAVLAASLRAPNASPAALRARAESLAKSGTGTSFAAARNEHEAPSPSSGIDEKPVPVLDFAGIEDAVARAVARPALRASSPGLAMHAARRLAAAAPRCRDIPSSLDAGIQRVAEQALARRLADLRDRSARDGAVLVVDNASGEVLAYVGSSGALSKSAQVDGVRARRQAGSTLKPFLYASAIERGLVTPATLLEDEPLDVAVDGGVYRPANYDDSFRGLVSVRTALAASLNVPAVRTLLLVGDDAFTTTLRSLGLASVTEPGSFYGPSLALGSADVTLWDMVGAYRALARGGTWSPLRWGRGDAGEERRVFSPEASYLVADILADRESRATTFGLENALATPYWTAVKTGTSKDMRDNWCLGFSRLYTVGVWVGNFGGESMHDVSGVSGAAPVWEDVMDALHGGVPSDAPPAPGGIVDAWTTFAQGAEAARREHYVAGSEPVAAASRLGTLSRIAEPTDGSILALDPDIPRGRQRVPFVAEAAGEDLAWKLDGRAIGSARAPLLWEPAAGRHELALVDASGEALDRVKFDVRGTPRR